MALKDQQNETNDTQILQEENLVWERANMWWMMIVSKHFCLKCIKKNTDLMPMVGCFVAEMCRIFI